MNYAIISAGEGSRLRQEGIRVPKPLVKLNGTPMIERLIRNFSQNNAKSISIIINDIYPETKEFLEFMSLAHPLNIICKTTPSSLHSFYELIPYLRKGKFCLTTVDTIFNSDEFSKYIRRFENDENIDGLMAVTSHIDDESPLYVETDEDLNIIGFHDSNNGECQYISGGIYCLNSKALETVQKAYDAGTSRMRNLQRELLKDGLRLKAYPFSKILDIDHAGDIEKAQQFIQEIDVK